MELHVHFLPGRVNSPGFETLSYQLVANAHILSARRFARRFAAQTDCADAHALPWLRIWHVLVTCKRVLPQHLRHLSGSHSTARDAALIYFLHGMLSLLLHFEPAADDFVPPGPDESLSAALLALCVHSDVGRVASVLLEVLHANATRRSPSAYTIRAFLALLVSPAASDLPMVGARVLTVLVAHLLTCRQVDLCLAGTPSGLRAMMRQHAGTTATDLDALALSGIGERRAVDTPADPVQCLPPGGSPAGDMAVSDVDSECELAAARPLQRAAPKPLGCAPLVRALRAVPYPLDGSMPTAALLTALRDVARAGGVTAAQSRRVAFATCLTVHPALPDFLRQTPASALAALRACARSNGAPPCGVPPSTAVKRPRCCASGGNKEDTLHQRRRLIILCKGILHARARAGVLWLGCAHAL